MNGYQGEFQRLVDSFVSSLLDIWRRQAIHSLTGVTDGSGHRIANQRRSAPVVALGQSRGRGGRRTNDEMSQIAAALLDFVRTHPGLRIEQINKQLGTSTKDVARPIRKLLADGALKAKGKRRSTTYYPR
jgi:predicted HTH transcriptional regulator